MLIKLVLFVALFVLSQICYQYAFSLSNSENLILQYQVTVVENSTMTATHMMKFYDPEATNTSIEEQVDYFCKIYSISASDCDAAQQDVKARITQVNSPVMKIDNNNQIYRLDTIWILWWQGWDQAPPIVLKCLQSWHHHHSPLQWNIILLDKNNIGNFIDLKKVVSEQVQNLMSLTALSDVIRWLLLYEYGGVWVDSTVFCHRPITSWLNITFIGSCNDYDSSGNLSNCYVTENVNMPTNYDELDKNPFDQINNNFTSVGFYAISNRRNDLFIDKSLSLRFCTFFLVSIRKGYIASMMIEAIRNYWYKRPQENFYFWLNLLFTELLNSNSKFNELWNAVDSPNQYYCNRIHYFQSKFGDNMTNEMHYWLNNPDVPISKLTHKYNATRVESLQSVFNYLLASD